MPVNPQGILLHREKYISSVRLRYPNSNLAELVDAALECFHHVKTLEQQLNRWGKDGTIQNSTSCNSNIQQSDLALARANLRSALWKLPNWLDDDIMLTEYPTNKEEQFQQQATVVEKHNMVQEDPAFCAGIYDTTTIGGRVNISNKGCMMTSLGTKLLRKLEEVVSTSLGREFSNPVSRWEVPSTLEQWEKERWNDFFGSPVSKGSNDAETHIAVPSAFTILNNRQTLTDRELPKAFLLDCIDTTTTTTTYKREKMAWTKRLAIRKHLELVVITGPSFGLDTKPCCQRLIANIKETLRLLGDANGLVLKSVRPEYLQSAESSAVQFESPDGDCLATLYNYRDYCTGRLLRHGTTKENLHVTRVVIDVPEILNWMVHIHTSTDSSICLPSSIFVQNHCLPFIRRIVRGKGGKLVVQAIPRSDGKNAITIAPSFSAIDAEATALSYSFLPLYTSESGYDFSKQT